MKHSMTLAVLVSFLLVSLPSAAQVPADEAAAQEVNDWISEYDLPGRVVTENELEQFLLGEAYIEQMRLERSDVSVLKRNKHLDFDPALHSEINRDMAEWLEVIKVPVRGGKPIYMVRPLSPEEVNQRRLEAQGYAKDELSDAMKGMAVGMSALGLALRAGIKESGFGAALADESKGVTPHWLRRGFGDDCAQDMYLYNTSESEYIGGLRGMGIAPVTYMLSHACMLVWAAQQLDNIEIPTAEQYAAAQRRQLDELKKYAKIAGKEVVDGRQTLKVEITGLDIKEESEDGRTIEIDNMSMWLDPAVYKRRKIRFEGTMTEGGKSQEFFMERENQDYRRVGDSYLYEPYAEVVRVGGVLTDEERRELAKAQKELEKAEAELAAMPASQRAMVEKMMGSQMAQMRSLVNTGMFETRIITSSIEINPDFATAFGPATIIGAGPGGGASGGTDSVGQGNNTSLGSMAKTSGSDDAGKTQPDPAPTGDSVATTAQEACLEEAAAKAAAKREADEKKNSFGRLMGAVTRTASRLGVGLDISEVTRGLYEADATADDVQVIANELGITKDEVERCRDAN